jgi:hypothetical protein
MPSRRGILDDIQASHEALIESSNAKWSGGESVERKSSCKELARQTDSIFALPLPTLTKAMLHRTVNVSTIADVEQRCVDSRVKLDRTFDHVNIFLARMARPSVLGGTCRAVIVTMK